MNEARRETPPRVGSVMMEPPRPPEESDDVEFDDSWMTSAEMLRCGMTKRLDGSKRVAKLLSKNGPDLQGKRLQFLTKNDQIQPDGNLAQCKPTRTELGSVRWLMKHTWPVARTESSTTRLGY